MSKTFDPTKPVQTRDGRKARIICTDAKSDDYPIIALVEDEDGVEGPEAFTAEGHWFAGKPGSETDLINIPEKHVRWVNLYPSCVYQNGGFGSTYTSRALADAGASHDRIACIRIEFTEGEGLGGGE